MTHSYQILLSLEVEQRATFDDSEFDSAFSTCPFPSPARSFSLFLLHLMQNYNRCGFLLIHQVKEVKNTSSENTFNAITESSSSPAIVNCLPVSPSTGDVAQSR